MRIVKCNGSNQSLHLKVKLKWISYPRTVAIYISIATGSGHPDHQGQPGHILHGSTGSDPLYKISGSDLDLA